MISLRQTANQVLSKHTPLNVQQQITKVLQHRTKKVRIVLDNLHTGSNASAIFRTCDLLGIQYVDTIKTQYDFEKTTTRKQRGVSRRADLWLNINTHKDPSNLVQQLKKEGYKLLVTDLSPGAIPTSKLRLQRTILGNGQCTPNSNLEEVEGPKEGDGCYWVKDTDKIALILGCEMIGVSPFMRDNADVRLYIPTFGFSQSFNVAATAAYFLSTFQHIGIMDGVGNLSEDEKEKLTTRFLLHFSNNTKLTKRVVLKELLARSGVVVTEEQLTELLNT